MTNYPHGVSSYGIPLIGSGPVTTTGKVFFVHASSGIDSPDRGSDPSTPFASLDYAVGRCRASKGDVIFAMPGHTESITAATSLVIDVAGISIIGLGVGSSLPTLTFTTVAAATISITAANVMLQNLRLVSAFTNGITAGIVLGAAADGARLINIRMEESLVTQEFLIGISIAAACHDVIIDGFSFHGIAAGGDSQAIIFVGASNFSKVRNFDIMGDFSGAPIDALTALSTYMEIGPGVILNIDVTAGLSVSVKSDTTGIMHDLRVGQLKDTVGPVGAGMVYAECYVTNAVNKNGILKPGVDV